MKHKVRIPSDLKRKYCKKCLNFLMPSVNCRVRLQKGKVVYYCTNCRNYSRFPYTKEKKALKQALKFNQK